MFFHLSQYYIKKFRPQLNGLLTKIIYSGKRVSIGKGFRADSIPKIVVDKGCELSIGDQVEFRRNIEIRVHKASKVIIENNVRIDRGVRILSTNEAPILIKQKTRIGLYSVFNGGARITVGEACLISGFVYLQTSMHAFSNPNQTVQSQGYQYSDVELKNDVWLGTHVVIFPGTILGKGSVVGSNAVVNSSFDDHSVVAGVPAKKIKNRD